MKEYTRLTDSFDKELNLLETFSGEERDDFSSLVFRRRRRRLQVVDEGSVKKNKGLNP